MVGVDLQVEASPQSLPEGWGTATLGDLFEIKQGKALSQRVRSGSGSAPFLRTANVFWGRLDISKLDQMDFLPREKAALALRPGDLLVCEGGDIGRTALWNGEIEGCFYQNHLHRLRAKSKCVEPAFVMFWMQAAFLLLGRYQGLGNKTTIPNLSKGRLAAFELPLPPLPEQWAIARVLNAVERAIEVSERVIASTQQLKRSLMQYLFTYGPVPVSEAERVELLEADDGLSPGHWERTRLDELCSAIVDCPHSTPTWTQAGVLAVRNTNIRNGEFIRGNAVFTTEQDYLQRTRRLVPVPGDVLLSREAPIGEACVVPADTRLSLGQRIMLLRPEPGRLDSHYLVYAIYGEPLRTRLVNQGSGVTAHHINVSDVRALVVPTPPITDQKSIARDLLSTQRKLGAERSRVVALQQLFRSLLEELMTGRLRVPQEAIEATNGPAG